MEGAETKILRSWVRRLIPLSIRWVIVRTISRNPFGDFVQWLAFWVSDAIVNFAMAPKLARHSTCILWEDLEASPATNQAVRSGTADFRVKLQVKRPQMSLVFSHTLLSQNQTANSKPIG